MSGHLFVTRGDLAELACDAVLVPTGSHGDRFGHVAGDWSTLMPSLTPDTHVDPAPDRERRIVQLRRSTVAAPDVWAGLTGDRGTEDAAWYADAIREFVRAASTAQRPDSRSMPIGDRRPLLAVPLIGTGQGGMRQHRGEVILAIAQAITEELDTTEVDVALVLRSAESYAAAQQARAAFAAERMPKSVMSVAGSLAADARQSRLVLFMGAGIGAGAALPKWRDLLERLGRRAEMTESEVDELLKLDARDAGVILDQRLQAMGVALVDAISQEVAAPRVSLAHQLLASLPVREAVTTNYDTLFERAWTAAGQPHAVLPGESARDADRWLLKLHGSVGDRRLVLSRDDYLRFEDEGVALAGVVQAMLLTRHMLFVGYSLQDDNFHRLVHQVRAVLGPSDERRGGPFATALTPSPPRLAQEVWRGDIEFISTADEGTTDTRRLAVMLDAIGMEAAAPAAHFLDDSYEAILDPDERTLRDRLAATLAAADSSGVRPSVRQAVIEAITTLGGGRPRS